MGKKQSKPEPPQPRRGYTPQEEVKVIDERHIRPVPTAFGTWDKQTLQQNSSYGLSSKEHPNKERILAGIVMHYYPQLVKHEDYQYNFEEIPIKRVDPQEEKIQPRHLRQQYHDRPIDPTLLDEPLAFENWKRPPGWTPLDPNDPKYNKFKLGKKKGKDPTKTKLVPARWDKALICLYSDGTFKAFEDAFGVKEILSVNLHLIKDFIAYGDYTKGVPGLPPDVDDLCGLSSLLAIPIYPVRSNEYRFFQFKSAQELHQWLVNFSKVLIIPKRRDSKCLSCLKADKATIQTIQKDLKAGQSPPLGYEGYGFGNRVLTDSEIHNFNLHEWVRENPISPKLKRDGKIYKSPEEYMSVDEDQFMERARTTTFYLSKEESRDHGFKDIISGSKDKLSGPKDKLSDYKDIITGSKRTTSGSKDTLSVKSEASNNKSALEMKME